MSFLGDVIGDFSEGPLPPVFCLGGCGLEVTRGSWTCPECLARVAKEEHSAALNKAWNTIPEGLRWSVSLTGPKVLAAVTDHDALARAREIAADLPAHPLVTLVGPQGAGKTTIACALMRAWMNRGRAMTDQPKERVRSRGTRFVRVEDILREHSSTRLGGHVESLDIARNASVLVLDEVGRGKDTFAVIADLLGERHGNRRPTILTTPHLTAETFAEFTGDGGFARRVFDDATVLRVRKGGR